MHVRQHFDVLNRRHALGRVNRLMGRTYGEDYMVINRPDRHAIPYLLLGLCGQRIPLYSCTVLIFAWQ